MKKIICIILTSVFFSLSQYSVFAETVHIIGRVKANSDMTISSSSLVFTNTSSNEKIILSTDPSGIYSSSLPSGEYRVSITSSSQNGNKTLGTFTRNITSDSVNDFVVTPSQQSGMVPMNNLISSIGFKNLGFSLVIILIIIVVGAIFLMKKR